MRTVALSVLLSVAALLVFPAAAQETATPSLSIPATLPPLSATMQEPGWSGDTWRDPGGVDLRPIDEGLFALKRGKYVTAETAFAKVLRRDADNANANLFMGVARMNLGKWEAAKANLEIARDRLPAHPDPKSRLGVTYAKLGDTAGAYAQRAALVAMAESCNAGCKLAPFISSGIAMIDAALSPAS